MSRIFFFIIEEEDVKTHSQLPSKQPQRDRRNAWYQESGMKRGELKPRQSIVQQLQLGSTNDTNEIR